MSDGITGNADAVAEFTRTADTTDTTALGEVIQPVQASTETEDRRVDAKVAAALATVAGRPWCLKPESMDVLVAAISGGLTAGEYETGEPDEDPVTVANGVATIPLTGLITPAGGHGPLGALLGLGGGLRKFRHQLRDAVADKAVKRIVLDVDSPGGLVDHVPETAAAIRATRDFKPITAVASTQAASAAYWLASQSDELVVTPSGEVGSIGVYMMHMDKSGALADAGIDVTLTSAGKYKTEGNQYEPLSPEAKKAQQRKVDRFYEMFVGDVADGRRTEPRLVRDGYGEGRTLVAMDAVDSGLADHVGTLDGVIAREEQRVTEDRTAAEGEALEAARRRVAVALD